MKKQQSPKCHRCDKVLVKIGTARSNGSNQYTDWKGRKYHKKCIKAINDAIEIEIKFNQMMDRYKDDI